MTSTLAPSRAWWCAIVAGFFAAGFVTSSLPLVGVLVFLLGAVAILRFDLTRGERVVAKLRKRPGLRALVIAVATNVFVFGHSLVLFTLAGTQIRPLIWNFEALLLGAVCVLWVAALAIASVGSRNELRLAGIAFLAALEAVFLFWQLLRLGELLGLYQVAQ